MVNLKTCAKVAVLGVVFGFGWFSHSTLTTPTTQIEVVHDTQQVRVEVPVLTDRVVDRVIIDPKQQVLVNQLLKENHELKTQISSVISTTAQNTTQGSGTAQEVAGDQVQGYPTFSFKDYQLEATYRGPEFSYKLSQDFRIVSTVGRDRSGKSVGLLRLYQDTPEGPKEIPAQTTVVSADPTGSRWLASPRIQAGVGVDKSGLVGLQWLKRGKSNDPKDLQWALLTPAYASKLGVGVLPVSFNLGSLPKQPFTNIWVSPFVSKDKKLGAFLTATF